MRQFSLWVVAVGDDLQYALDRLDLESVHVIPYSSFETPRLKRLASERGIGQLCWTLTPLLPELVWERAPDADVVTYIDTDLYFLRSPESVFEEFTDSGAAVLLTPHAYDPRFDASAESGFFCVQFMPFRKTSETTRVILRSWASDCLGESGATWQSDQKFLDTWPATYGDDVHVLARPQLFQGPWNMARFPYSEAVAFHFHGLRLKNSRRIWLGTNPIPAPTMRNVYRPYLDEFSRALKITQGLGLNANRQRHPMSVGRRLATVGVRSVRVVREMLPGRSTRLPS